MIYNVFISLVSLFFLGLVYYFFKYGFDAIALTMETAYPTYFTGAQYTLFKALITWSLFFGVIAILIYVMANSQRPRDMI